MAEIRFYTAMRNAVQRQTSGAPGPGASRTVSAIGSTARVTARRLTSRVKRRFVPVIRPLAELLRRYFVGALVAKVDALHIKADALRSDYDAQFANQSARIDAALAKMDTLLRMSTSIRHETQVTLPAMQTRLDDISVKVRGPIEVDGETLAIRTADGFVLAPRRDLKLAIMLTDASTGGLEPGTRQVLQRLLDPAMTFVDVGAHIGLHTLVAAREVGPGGEVYAFEPTPSTFSLLTRTVALNGLGDRVQAFPTALGSQAGRQAFHLHEVAGHNSLVAPGPDEVEEPVERIEVDVARLDDLIPERRSVDVVKIDAEGAELAVLAGMERIVAANPELVIIAEFGSSHLARTGVSAEAWFKAFEAHGLLGHAIDEDSGRCAPVRHVDVLGRASLNIAFAKRDSRATERLAG